MTQNVANLLRQFDEQEWDENTLSELFQEFIEQQSQYNPQIIADLEVFLKISANMICPTCQEEMDKNCSGDLFCPNCDGPCPSCSDGGI
jgi:uncharacterized membrane protein YgaE (UPF0421/DUF939 family)